MQASDGTLVLTEKAASDGTISVMAADGSNKRRVFTVAQGAAFAPTWSPDGQWIAFGVGGYLQARKTQSAKLMLMRRDGSELRASHRRHTQRGLPELVP